MRRVFDTRRAGGESGDEPVDRISDGSGTDRYRGQAHVLGLVLLIGAVAVASIGIVVLGSSSLETQQTTIEAEYAEQSLLEFAHTAETTVVTDRGPSDVSLGPFDRGHVTMRDDAGRVTITRVNGSGSDEVLYNEPLGTLAYVNDDTEIAYQGGGVWRTDGAGAAMVSAPGIEYRDGTLTFPLVQLGGDRVGGNAIDGTVRQAATPTQIALDDRSGHDRGSVTTRIDVESEYCDAWERELEDSLEGSVIEGCEEGEPQRVRIQLLTSENGRSLGGAVIGETVTANPNGGSGKHLIDGDVRAGTITIDESMVNGTLSHENYDYPSADEEIDRALEACDEYGELNGTVTQPGVHCVNEIDSNHHFDTSNGDIDVVVRESFDLPHGNGNLSVTGSNDLTIYADTGFEVRGNAAIGNESNASQTRLVFSSKSTVQTASGTPEINALLYAPESTVTLNGTPTVVGTVVGDEVSLGSAAVEIRDDGSLTTLEYIPGAGPRVPYATVTAYEAKLDD
ncbi:hypothetical protein ACFR99_07700 [Haloarchaeobius amylolyticus]|uniref:DUF7305 domain-containing protein n=1 Tax=Haloarchaeobius amylolyticus TaxID=1198296 RepID=A0ABD6BEE7_9EURY